MKLFHSYSLSVTVFALAGCKREIWAIINNRARQISALSGSAELLGSSVCMNSLRLAGDTRRGLAVYR